MRPYKLPFILLLIIVFTSCKNDKDNTLYEERYYIQYGDSIIETNGGLLYLYDKNDREYYYTIVTTNLRHNDSYKYNKEQNI